MSSLKDAARLLEMYRRFIINHDIPVAIKGKSNYLAALGLSTYTEVFGGLYRGRLSPGSGKKNYYAFIRDFFDPEYMVVDSQLSNDGLGGLYGAVRSGLVHEYLIRDTSMVVMHRRVPMNCGILYDPKGTPKIKFVVEQYFDDFKNAFNHYFNRIKIETNLLTNLENALNSINSPLPHSRQILP